MQQLSKRLKHLISYVDDNKSFIDVAADHGYVALALAKMNPNRKIVVSDIAKLPLESGMQNFKRSGLDADFRLGSGLEVLEDGEYIDIAIIAGIGGRLMVDILQKNLARTKQIDTFVLSANIGMELVRKWLFDNNYIIEEDIVIEDDGRFYECIKAKKDTEKDNKYASDEKERELQFYLGTRLAQQLENDGALAVFIQERIDHLISKIEQLKKAKASNVDKKIGEYTSKVEKLKELLK